MTHADRQHAGESPPGGASTAWPPRVNSGASSVDPLDGVDRSSPGDVTLHVCTLNIQTNLPAKLCSLLTFVITRNVDVLCIQEAGLSQDSVAGVLSKCTAFGMWAIFGELDPKGLIPLVVIATRPITPASVQWGLQNSADTSWRVLPFWMPRVGAPPSSFPTFMPLAATQQQLWPSEQLLLMTLAESLAQRPETAYSLAIGTISLIKRALASSKPHMVRGPWMNLQESSIHLLPATIAPELLTLDCGWGDPHTECIAHKKKAQAIIMP